MEIRIKTAEEFHDAHVTIEVNGARLYTASEVGALQASEAELVAKPLQAALAERADRIAELQAQLSKAEVKAHAFNLDRKSEDELVAAPLRRRIAELEAENAKMTERVDRWMAAAHDLEASGGRQRITELEEEIRRMDDQISAQTERADKLNERNAGLAGELARERDRNAELVEQLARVDKGHVCVEACRPNAHVAFQGRGRVRELEEEIQRMDDQISIQTERSDEINERNAELVGELARQRNYAVDNREWAERAEGRLAQSEVARTEAERKLKDAERAIQILSAQLGRISGAVHSVEMVKAMNPMYRSPETVTMAEAIRQVRDALGSPSFPEAAGGSTSQA